MTDPARVHGGYTPPEPPAFLLPPDVAVALTANLAVSMAEGAGNVTNPGGTEALRRYWLTGEGGTVKIRWRTSGDYTRCVRELREHLGTRAEGYCANLHKLATGVWPGDRRNV